ncbi:hypothetical protein P8452_02136 [Trifolium repens]|nr:hypothetical protein P8452_02136 [Trifolium repens]
MGCGMKPANRGEILGMLAGRPLWSLERGFIVLDVTQKFIVLAERGVTRGSERPSLPAAGSEYHSVTSR